MTTLYKPVPIKSVAQAEALDWKTPIHIVLARTQEVHDVRLFEDFVEDFWPDALEPDNRWAYVALVPIKAEEEWAVSHDRDAPAWSSVTKERAQSPGVDETAFVRHATPWEEA